MAKIPINKGKAKLDNIITTPQLVELTNFIRNQEKGYFRDRLIKLLTDEGDRADKIILERAVLDKHITEAEIKRLIKEYGVKHKEIAQIFQFVYNQAIVLDDDSEIEKIVMVTMQGSGIWRMRHYIEKKYGMQVKLMDEVTEIMMKTDKKQNTNYIG